MDGEDHYHYSPLYYFFVVWEVVLTLIAFATLMKRCSLSMCKKKWYVPAILFFIGFTVDMIYIIIGGSPEINGTVLYTIQEVWAFLFVGMWEGCIYIGLLPTNSGYSSLFAASHTGAAILDKQGEVVYSSSDYFAADVVGDDEKVLHAHDIRGGSVVWTEDHSKVIAANRELENLTHEMLEENELIEEENKVAEKMAIYEERNRLYDAMAHSLKPEFEGLKSLLLKETGEKDERENLTTAAVLGAYIKRRANLTLLADRQKTLNSRELTLSIRESFEYLTLTGCACEINEVSSTDISADYVQLTFDFYEAILEDSVSPLTACFVRIEAEPCYKVTIETDEREGLKEALWQEKMLKAGLQLHCKIEDDTAVFVIEERGKTA